MANRVILIAALLAAGCSWLCPTPEPRTVVETVEVPVPYREPPAAPPAWLAERYKPDTLPAFIDPGHDAAVLALDKEGAAALRAILRQLTGRDEAWRAWAVDLQEQSHRAKPAP